MMKYENLFKIHIPEPCHEDWNKMTANEQGSFCNVCAKTVVDFSGKTDEQVQRYLLENMEQKICGRFKVTQLESNEEAPKLKVELEAPKLNFPSFLLPVMTPFRVCAMAVMIFASAALAGCGNSGSGGGDNDRTIGAVELIDSTAKEYNHKNIIDTTKPDVNFDDKTMGAVNWNMVKDSTCKVEEPKSKNGRMLMGEPVMKTVVDSVKADTTEREFLLGEIQKKN